LNDYRVDPSLLSPFQPGFPAAGFLLPFAPQSGRLELFALLRRMCRKKGLVQP